VLDAAALLARLDAIMSELAELRAELAASLPAPAGPFRDRFALYDSMRPRERVEVLLALFGAHQRVTLPRNDVEAIG
jgi:hypothetical protein